jgi:hypothetical protein
MRAKEHALILSLFVVLTFGFTVESIKELGGASHMVFQGQVENNNVINVTFGNLSILYPSPFEII